MSPTQDQESLGENCLSNEGNIEPMPTVEGKHKKARPSIDVNLAQEYKQREKLPDFGQGRDPRPQKANEQAAILTKSGVGQNAAGEVKGPGSQGGNREEEKEKEENGEEEEEGEKKPKRDATTGRVLAEDGVSCLRCTKKGLRCTLHFFGLDAEPLCAACRRSNAAHCIRQRKVQDRVAFAGPPWKDPNFTTGSAGEPLPREQMEAALREHFEGEPSSYLRGGYGYGYGCAAAPPALPAFNYGDLPWEERPKGWHEMDWRKALPTHMNRSLTSKEPLPKKELPKEQPSKGKPSAKKAPQKDSAAPEVVELDEEAIKYLRVTRRYPPREAHLTEEFPGAW